jgi:pantoate--beta-alanine ligase
MVEVIATAPEAKLDYAEIVDPETLQPVARIEKPVLAALAVWVGRARLIDNMVLDPGGLENVGAD